MKATYPSLLLTSALILVLTSPKAVSQSAADPYKKGKLEQVPAKDMPQVVSIHEEAFSLPIAEAYTLLHEAPTDQERYQRVVELVKAGKARIEKLVVVRTKSGMRSVTESTNEIRYPVEFGPPPLESNSAKLQKENDARHRASVEAEEAKKLGQPAPAAGATPSSPPNATQDVSMAGWPTPLKFENRNAGDTLEVEPVVGPDGETVDLNLVSQCVRLLEEREYGGKYPVKQPVFQTQKISTSITLKDGKPALLGTPNVPPPVEYAVDEKNQTVWLDFITVHLVRL